MNKISEYGYCPICYTDITQRSRGIDGFDMCRYGHTYKSSESINIIGKWFYKKYPNTYLEITKNGCCEYSNTRKREIWFNIKIVMDIQHGALVPYIPQPELREAAEAILECVSGPGVPNYNVLIEKSILLAEHYLNRVNHHVY